MEEQNSLSTRLNAYLMLERVVLSLDESDDDIAEEIRSLMDVLWCDFSNEDQVFLDSRLDFAPPEIATEAYRELTEPPKSDDEGIVFCPACKSSNPEWIRLHSGEFKCNVCGEGMILSPSEQAFEKIADEYFSSVSSRPLPAVEFETAFHHNPDNNTLSIFINDEPSFCDRINSKISVFRSMQTKAIVGFRVKTLNVIPASCTRCEDFENRLVNEKKEKKELADMFCICLEDMHTTLQGDLSYDKVNKVKKRIELLLTGRAKL